MTILVAVGALLTVVSIARPRPPCRGIEYRRRSVSPLRVVAPLGRIVRRRLPVEMATTPAEIGSMVVGAALAIVVAPPLAVLAPLALVVRSTRRRRSDARRQVDDVRRGLPEVVDLLVLGVGAGLTVRDAIAASADWMPQPFDSVFADAVRRSDAGEPLVESLEAAVAGLGEAARPLLTVLAASERDGAAVLPALERASDEARRRRRVEAEEAVRRIPVAMLFPLVLCVLPAFALLTVVPVLVGSLSDLRFPSAGP